MIDLFSQLADNRLFREVDLAQIEGHINTCTRHNLMPGDTLIEANARNSTLYLVLSGQLRVYAGGRDLPANAVLGANDCVGELSLIDGERSSALVLAAEPTDLIGISYDLMWDMIELVPLIARNLLAIMSGRMRNNNLTLVTTQSRTLEFEQASIVDTLTGLHNRRWIDESFMRLVRRSRNDGVAVCLLLIDIDRLGRINERNGYLTGDSIMKRIAHCIAESLRPQDLIGRSGGDTFAVLLPHTRPPVAQGIASRLCGIVVENDIYVPPSREPMTISCGVIEFGPDNDIDTAFTRAEQALQLAKDNGRNRAELLE